MRPETRKKFNGLAQQLATLNDANIGEDFTVTPAVQQKLEQKAQADNGFLSKINMYGVVDLVGQKIGVGVSSTVAGRTNTGTNDRTPRDIADLDANGYHLRFTEFDTAIKYASLDAWARHANFQPLVRNAIIHRQSLDRIMIGWNGTSVATATNRTSNPLLQDVNKGWLQKYREEASDRVMTESTPSAGTVTVGKFGDYKNLDALVMDAKSELIDEWNQDDPSLVVILGRDLMHDKYFPIVNTDNAPSEQLAAGMVISQKRVGGLPAVTVPYFPATALMITSLDNLSIYYQIGARRQQIIDNPRRNQIENYESSNEDYVVEEFGKGCVVENITFVEVDPAG